MAEDIKSLIEKIQQEGIQTAQTKAKEIESQATQRAEEIIQEAKLKASLMVTEAQEKIAQMEERQKALLTQAGRDFLLLLKRELNSLLDKLILTQVKEALSPEAMFKIILDIVKEGAGKEKANIIISLNKEDLRLLEKNFLHKLKEETKKSIVLKPSEDIQEGFTISYDSGKSLYDFSDRALAEYVGIYLKPKLAEILKEAAE